MKASPMARLQQKTQAAVTTGSAGSTGIPRAMALRLIRDLLGVPGLLAAVARNHLANLIPASGNQDHTISPSVPGVARLATPTRPSHPAPNVRGDCAYAPLQQGRTARSKATDLPDAASGIFATGGVTGGIGLNGFAKQADGRMRFAASADANPAKSENRVGLATNMRSGCASAVTECRPLVTPTTYPAAARRSAAAG